ncbi:MAG: hypothetical protein QOJ29_4431 [Thermoleophilaceae bacterium]|jgi:lysophospholipase L1-like esterase|nr:hypothetical protein [Thermoleophilaceae bacterium]
MRVALLQRAAHLPRAELVRPSRVALALVLLAGCAGSTHPAPTAKTTTSAPAPVSQRLRVAALGDSITAGSPQWDPNPAIRAQLGDSVSPGSQYEYWAQKQLGPKVTIRNCGVFGERTDQIALRLDECARGASVLVVQGGINDIAQGRSPESAAANLARMVATAQRKKLRVVLVNVLPWNRGYPGAAPLIDRLNAAITLLGRNAHVPVVDFYKALDDPASPGRIRQTMTDDGDHPTVAGYRVLGELLAPALAPR